jgi:hypothetical protein
MMPRTNNPIEDRLPDVLRSHDSRIRSLETAGSVQATIEVGGGSLTAGFSTLIWAMQRLVVITPSTDSVIALSNIPALWSEIVVLNGYVLDPVIDYALNDDTLQIITPLAAGDVIVARYQYYI